MSMKYCNNNGKQPKGFTVIEIIAVLIIIAVVVVIVVSRITSFKPYNIAAEVDILKANVRYAQFRALSDADTASGSINSTWGVSFSVNSYQLQHNYNSGAANTYNFPGESSPTHTLPSGLTIISGSNITFDAWGSPGATNIAITVTDGKSPKTITVTQNTGFIP